MQQFILVCLAYKLEVLTFTKGSKKKREFKL